MINITKGKRQREALRPLSGFLPLLAVTLQYTSFSLNTPFNVIFKSILLSQIASSPQIYSSALVVSMGSLWLQTVAIILAIDFWKR